MDKTNVTSTIVGVRQINGMLQLLDAEKHNQALTLGELYEKFEKQYKIDPTSESLFFYNQYQFIASLFVYICLPSQEFYDGLPIIDVKRLSVGWGTSKLKFEGSLRSLIRHLRNAIAHGRISITEQLIFQFENHGCVVTFDHVELHNFCQALAYWCLTKDVDLSGI